MNDCCHPSQTSEPANRFFSRWSKRYAKRFRKGGLDKEQRYLLDGIRRSGGAKGELLDIGCGVGSLHLTLLREGAVAATGVDISEGMLAQAKKIAEEYQLKEKTNYILGDFVQEAEAIRDADVTMMDKLVCCYEDYHALIETSASKTKRILALTHPRENFMMMSIFKLQIFFSKLFRAAFHPFWHDWTEIRRLIEAKGFHQVYSNSTISWQVLVYERVQ